VQEQQERQAINEHRERLATDILQAVGQVQEVLLAPTVEKT